MSIKPDNLNLNLNLNLGAAAAAGAGASGGRARFNTEDFPKLARLPQPSIAADDYLAAVPTFAHRTDWDAEGRSWLHLAEFIKEIPQVGPLDPNKGTFEAWLLSVQNGIDTSVVVPPAKPFRCPAGPTATTLNIAELNDEIAAMVDASLDRADRLQEIVDQADGEGALNYWTGMLGLNPATRPGTHLLVRVGRRIGELVVMRLKDVYKCPRPSAIHPLIVPAIDPPDTPSFPSGHATQSFLISGLLIRAIDPAGATPPPTAIPPAHLKTNTLPRALMALAARVAENRTVAGLHYPADGRAGLYVARRCLARAVLCPSILAVIGLARNENR